MINFQQMIPEVYSEESRDFQILCKAGDFVFNSAKYESDSIVNILDTDKIKGSFLPLLQTKLGFFSSSSTMNDDELRLILKIFPKLIKLKGSDLAIKYLLNACLKLYNISAEFKIERLDGNTEIGNIKLDRYSVLVGINKVISISNIVKELMDYIMPPGYKLYIYFYTDIPLSSRFQYKDTISLIYSSDNINSNIRSLYQKDGSSFVIDDENNLIGAVDILRVFSESENGLDNSNFLGIFDSELDLPSTAVDGNLASTGESTYYRYGNTWNKLFFNGIKSDIEQPNKPFEIIGLKNVSNKIYYRYDGEDWVKLNARGSISEQSVFNPKENDFINKENNNKYFNGSSWVSLNNYLGIVREFPSNPNENDYCYLNGIKYYISLDGSTWQDYTKDYYLLEYYNID